MAHLENSPVPQEFMNALLSLRNSVVRPEIAIEEIPAPRGLASYSVAIGGELADSALVPAALNFPSFEEVAEDDEPLTSGKFILLYDPVERANWGGSFRAVIHVRAAIDQEIGQDPLLTQAAWSWLKDAFEYCGAAHVNLTGTVTRSTSDTLRDIGISPQSQRTEFEIRASWTPTPLDGVAGIDLNFGSHLSAWTNLMCAAIGLPALDQGFPAQRTLRGPQSISQGAIPN